MQRGALNCSQPKDLDLSGAEFGNCARRVGGGTSKAGVSLAIALLMNKETRNFPP